MTAASRPLSSLAARAQLGDRESLEALLRALAPGLLRHLRSLTSDSSDADDALQETLWIIARRIGTLHDTTLVRAWAYRIATREAVRLTRRSRKHIAEELTDATHSAMAQLEVDPQILRSDAGVLDYLERLPARAQVVVRLRFVEDMSQQEIAEALEIPLGTVKSRLAYGLSRLRELLRQSCASEAGMPVT